MVSAVPLSGVTPDFLALSNSCRRSRIAASQSLRHKKDSFSITVMVRDEKTSIRFGCFPKGLIHSGDSAAATERRE